MAQRAQENAIVDCLCVGRRFDEDQRPLYMNSKVILAVRKFV